MAAWGHDRYEAEFLTETARLGDAVTGIDPVTPIPTCPQWTVRDLVSHVGTGHRWAADIVSGRLQQPPPYGLAEAPVDPGQWAAWLATGAQRLAKAVRDGRPDQPVWTWRAERTAGFWLRKMLHDEVIHRVDIELARGGAGAVATDLAVAGVSDLLDTIATLSPPVAGQPKFAGLAGTGETLHLHATDADAGAESDSGEWLARRTPAGVTWERGHARADVAVRAPARELLLVLNRRLPPDAPRVEVNGEASLFTYWLDHTRF